MSAKKTSPKRPLLPKNSITTRSGRQLKVNRSLGEKYMAMREAKNRRKVDRMRGLPKSRFKRLIWRMHPARLKAYWWSRDGGIMALKITGVGILVLFVLALAVFAYFRKDLPDVSDISGSNLGGSISFYDSTGKTLLWQDYNAVKRVPVQSDQISNYMKEATVATEDRNFYNEHGFDLKSIVRAAYVDVFHPGSGTQGGSTITEQLVKLTQDFNENRSLSLKAKELILAVELERTYTKDQILTGYLNVAPYGSIDYGVQAAATDYFHENASQLTLPQAAMLAAIPKSPSVYSPYAGTYFDKTDFLARYDYVLDSMEQTGKITAAQDKAAKAVDILATVQPQQTKYANIIAPYFVQAADEQLDQQFAAQTANVGGWKVITTLNMGLQNDAVQDVNNNDKTVAAVGGDEQAMVAEDVQTGQVVAQVGGEDFNNPSYGQINYADTRLSPGSSMKPFLYAALIQNNNNVGAGSVLYDTQQALPGYPCTDKTEPTATSNGGNCLWDDNFIYPGPETIRYALAGSRNVPAVKASYEIVPGDTSSGYTNSINKWISMANSAIGTTGAYACYQPGVNVAFATSSDQTQCYGSAAIGSGDIALDQEVNGDSTLARLGAEIPQTYIKTITDADGKTIYQWKQPKATQVYSPDTAYIVNSMLDDPRATYLQPYQKFQNYNGWDIAVKTGTENQEYNGVMTAWSTQYAVIGFAGYHTLDQPLEEGHFEDITEPITRTWMEQALNALNTKPVNWTQPSDIKVEPSYVQRVSTGYGAEVPGPSTDLFPSWYAGGNKSSSSSQTIDKVSGLAATSCTPPLAKESETNSNAATWNIDIFNGGTPNIGTSSSAASGSASANDSDNIHSCSDTPPAIDSFFINGQDASDGETIQCGSPCQITTTVSSGTHAFSDPTYPQYPGTVNLIVNGQTAQSQNVSASPSTVSFTLSGSGSETVAIQVIDSVLYDSQSPNATISFAAAAAPGPTNGAVTHAAGKTIFTWTGSTPNYTVYYSNGTAVGAGCSNVSGTTCEVSPALPTNSYYIQDGAGNDSATFSG